MGDTDEKDEFKEGESVFEVSVAIYIQIDHTGSTHTCIYIHVNVSTSTLY